MTWSIEIISRSGIQNINKIESALPWPNVNISWKSLKSVDNFEILSICPTIS